MSLETKPLYVILNEVKDLYGSFGCASGWQVASRWLFLSSWTKWRIYMDPSAAPQDDMLASGWQVASRWHARLRM